MIAPEIFHDGRVALYAGDCLDVLRGLPDNHFDAVVTDPPYALVSIARRYGKDGAAPAQVGATGAYARASAGFMGKTWDTGERAFAVEFWAEVFRVLKPGGHVLAFSATRTVHRLTCAIEDAGFEIRDMVAWMYGSGFPKSHDVARGIDASDAVAARRERALRFTSWMRAAGITAAQVNALTDSNMGSHYLTAGAQPEVATAAMFDLLRPALPPVPAEIEELVRARTVESENLKRRPVVGQHEAPAHARVWDAEHTGSRVTEAGAITEAYTEAARKWQGWGTALKPALEPITVARKPLIGSVAENVLAHATGALNIDGCRIASNEAWGASGEAVGDAEGVALGAGLNNAGRSESPPLGRWPANVLHDGAAIGGEVGRYFYSAKADADDRIGSKHPTVKPCDLMRWCIRLVTPPGGLVLDPFAGTGTTGEAAFREGMRAVLIEREPEYRIDIARRMDLVLAGPAIRRAERAKARARTAAPAPLFGED